MIGNRLHLCRSAAGLSLRQLQARMDHGVSAQSISKYERNLSVPSSSVLIALADALDVSIDYLTRGEGIALEGVEFRTRQPTTRRQAARIEARVVDLLERYLAVEEILGLPSVAWDKPRDARWPLVRDLSEAEPAAMGLRTHWGLGQDPIPNLVELLEEKGIKVLVMNLSDIGCLTARVRRTNGDFATVVVVNRHGSGEQQRFTVAHELGHLLLEVSCNLREEQAAHRFAGAFLMPADTLRSEIGRHRKSIGWSELFELKRIFGVSVQALTYRCKDLGILSDSLFRFLLKEFTRFGWRTPSCDEPCAMTAEKPRRFQRLCFRALAEDAISEAKAAELLGISVYELNRWMETPPTNEPAIA